MNESFPHELILNDDLLDFWAKAREENMTDSPPVALYLKQRLMPVEGESGIIFPPTYADIGYNIDTLSDGSKVATIDSVGSQANRIEPLFKVKPYSDLVPQIEIELPTKDDVDGKKHIEKRSILDLAHRSADAVVYSTPTLVQKMKEAFMALRQRGDARPLCVFAPTSLVFGVWDSRGDSGEKRPRLIRSIIRAWDVEPLHAAAQFNSIWKALDESSKTELEKEAKAKNTKLSKKGFADAPAIFRKTERIPQFRDGTVNPEARVLGGVIVRGRIERDITVNLAALHSIGGKNEKEGKEIRRYLLSLALIAATFDIDLFLREGCHLRYADTKDQWQVVPRRGDPDFIELLSTDAQKVLLTYAQKTMEPFAAERIDFELGHKFDLKEAKRLLAEDDTEADTQ